MRPFRPLWLAAGIWVTASPPVPAADIKIPPEVVKVDFVSPHRLPQERLRSAVSDLISQPRSLGSIREALDRLWVFGIFSDLWVEEIPAEDGVILRFHLERAPFVKRISWKGNPALDPAELAAAALLWTNEMATEEKSKAARARLAELYASEGYHDVRIEIETATDPETNGRDITFFIEAGRRTRISKIRYRGAEGLPDRLLATISPLRAGDAYREASEEEGIRRMERLLRREGYLEGRVVAGEAVPDPATNGIDLTLEVSLGPKFQVEFSGNAALKETVLRERLTFVDSGIVDTAEVQANAREIEAFYRENGYHFAEVKGFLNVVAKSGEIRFEIDEGPKVLVESVSFQGNSSFPSKALAKEIRTRPPAFLRAGLFRQETLDLDARVLLGFYRSRGFPGARVGQPTVEFTEGRTRARVIIPIVEGPKVRVGEVTLEGNSAIPAEEILNALPIKNGDLWDRGKVDEGRAVIERLYARRGYHAARAEADSFRENGSIRIAYRIQEGRQTRISRILISGLILTDEEVVLRELPFGPGDPFNSDEMIEAERRLAGLGLFDRVDVDPLRPSPEPFSEVRIEVHERKPWRFDFGLGFSTDVGGKGFWEVAHDNLFGTARGLSFREELSERGDRTDLIYREPRVFGSWWQGNLGLFRERREEIGYDLERFGLMTGMQREIYPERIPGLRTSFGYRFERVRRFNVEPTLAAGDVEPGSQFVGRLTSSLTWDRRDNPLDPLRGSFHLLAADLGGIAVGSELDFFKTRLETHWFFDWFSPTVLALSGRVGRATALGDSEVPIEDRFFAGGSTTVRGFREDRLGPKDGAGNPTGGNAQLIFNVEWRFPLWRFLGGALFLDTGAISRDFETLSSGDFKSGAGGGLRIKTPVGPVRIDFGYALQPIQGERRWQIYLSVGNPF